MSVSTVGIGVVGKLVRNENGVVSGVNVGVKRAALSETGGAVDSLTLNASVLPSGDGVTAAFHRESKMFGFFKSKPAPPPTFAPIPGAFSAVLGQATDALTTVMNSEDLGSARLAATLGASLLSSGSRVLAGPGREQQVMAQVLSKAATNITDVGPRAKILSLAASTHLQQLKLASSDALGQISVARLLEPPVGKALPAPPA